MDRAAGEENCHSSTELQGLQEGTGLSSLSSSRGVRARGGQASLLLTHATPRRLRDVRGSVTASCLSVMNSLRAHWPYAFTYEKVIKLVNCSIQCGTCEVLLLLHYGKIVEILEVQSPRSQHVACP